MSHFWKVRLSFLVFTIFGLTFLFFYAGKKYPSFHDINLWFLFPVLLTVFLDIILGGFRMYVFAKPVAPELSLHECIVANMAGITSAALTPSQTGGGIACLYFLKKAGCPLAAAFALSLINFLFTLLVLISGGIFLFFAKSSILTPKFSILVQSATVFLSLWIIATLFVLLSPSPTLSLWQRCSSFLHLKKPFSFFETAKGYHHYVNLYLFKKSNILLKGFFINALLFINKFLIVFFIIRFLNTTAPLLDILAAQMILFLLGYTSPTPGGSGVIEIGAGLIMVKIIPEAKVLSFVFLWRFFSIYLPLTLSGVGLTIKAHLPKKMVT